MKNPHNIKIHLCVHYLRDGLQKFLRYIKGQAIQGFTVCLSNNLFNLLWKSRHDQQNEKMQYERTSFLHEINFNYPNEMNRKGKVQVIFDRQVCCSF